MHRGHILIGLDRLADAGTSLITGRKISEELGIRWPLLTYQVLLALNHFLAGEWDDAVAELEAGIGMAEETGETYLLPLGYDIMALIGCIATTWRVPGRLPRRPRLAGRHRSDQPDVRGDVGPRSCSRRAGHRRGAGRGRASGTSASGPAPWSSARCWAPT